MKTSVLNFGKFGHIWLIELNKCEHEEIDFSYCRSNIVHCSFSENPSVYTMNWVDENKI